MQMRTTVNIDDHLLQIAKSLAQARSVSVGTVISELVTKGLEMERQPSAQRENGFPVFSVPRGARPITLEDVKKAEDEL